MFSSDQKKLIEVVSAGASELGQEVLLIGGCVRNLLLNQELVDSDIDFLLVRDCLPFIQQIAEEIGGVVKDIPNFLTTKIESPKKLPSLLEVDFVRARSEIYDKPGALPRVQTATLEEDLLRRDFTINALAIDVKGLNEVAHQEAFSKDPSSHIRPIIIDRVGGIRDLDQRMIRVMQDESFVDDPTRIFRACRYATLIDGAFESKTESLLVMAVDKGGLEQISIARRWGEFKRSMALSFRSWDIFQKLKEFHILKSLDFIDFEQTEVLSNLERFCGLQIANGKIAAETLTVLVYLLTSKDKQSVFWQKLSISKKDCLSWTETLSGPNRVQVQMLSDAHLLVCLVLFGESDYMREAHSRKLLLGD